MVRIFREYKNKNCFLLFRKRFIGRLFSTFIELENGKKYTFFDLEVRSGKIVRLFESLALQKGDRVLVQAEKSPDIIFLYTACLKFGLVFVPLDPTYNEELAEEIVNDCKPSLIICQPEKLSLYQKCSIGLSKQHILSLTENSEGTFVDAFQALHPRLSISSQMEDDTACVLYTSGTTDRPKGVVLTHGSLALSAQALAHVWNFSHTDVLLDILNLFHGYGLFSGLNVCLYSGCKILLLTKPTVKKILWFLPAATVFMSNPRWYKQLVYAPSFEQRNLANVRLYISGSAPLLQKLGQVFFEKTGKKITDRYGMTEVIVNSTGPLGFERFGSCGKPIPGVEVRIMDDKKDICHPDVIGSIEIRSPYLFKKYWNDPAKTSRAFTSDGFFITGDLGYLDQDGYIWIAGRTADIITIGSKVIYPARIEAAIDSLEYVEESGVFLNTETEKDTCIVAAIKLRSNQHINAEIVREHLKMYITETDIPEHIFFVDALPRNSIGKIKRDRLEELYKQSLNLEKDIRESASEGFATALLSWKESLDPSQIIYNQKSVLARLFPSSVEDIVKIVHIANKYSVPLYPISRGFNWGYGADKPIKQQCVILDLSHLNKILGVDEKLGLVRVEPGVSREQLREFLKSKHIPFIAPSVGIGSQASLIGNALEKGRATPVLVDRFASMLSLRAVLADGSLYESSSIPPRGSSLAFFKWGVGPYIDGLFAQSNIGIVVEATFELSPVPRTVKAFYIALEEKELARATEKIRVLLQTFAGVVSHVSIKNKKHVLGKISALISDIGLSEWSVSGSIQGEPQLVEAAQKYIEKEFGELTKKIIFLDDKKINRIEKSILYRMWTPCPLSIFLLLKNIIAHASGSTESEDYTEGVTLEPERFLFVPIVIPMRGDIVAPLIPLMERICQKYNIPFSISLLNFSSHCFYVNLLIIFDDKDTEKTGFTRQCYSELKSIAEKHGGYIYRASTLTMDMIVDPEKNFWKISKKIKIALDPKNILSPGRYEM